MTTAMTTATTTAPTDRLPAWPPRSGLGPPEVRAEHRSAGPS